MRQVWTACGNEYEVAAKSDIRPSYTKPGRAVKPVEPQIDELHQLALWEFKIHPGMLRRINRRYQKHVEYLGLVIRRASRKGIRR